MESMEVERRARKLYSEACQKTVAEANSSASNPPRTVRIRSWDSLGHNARQQWYVLARDEERRETLARLNDMHHGELCKCQTAPVVCRVNGCTNPQHFHPVVVYGGRTDRGQYPSRLIDANRRIRQLEDELKAALRAEDLPGLQREILNLKAENGILKHKLETVETAYSMAATEHAEKVDKLEAQLKRAVAGRNYVTREDYNRLLAEYDRAGRQAKADVASLRGTISELEHANAAVTRDRDLAQSRAAGRQKSLNAAHERIRELERRNVKLGQRLSGQHPTQDYRSGYAAGQRVGKLKAGTRALMLLNQQRPVGLTSFAGLAHMRGYYEAMAIIKEMHRQNQGKIV